MNTVAVKFSLQHLYVSTGTMSQDGKVQDRWLNKVQQHQVQRLIASPMT